MNNLLIIDKDKCTGCEECVKICPNKILYIEKNICNVIDEKKCDKSKGCEKVCPTGAIKIQ